MKRLACLCFLVASVLSTQSSAQEVIPVETTGRVNLAVSPPAARRSVGPTNEARRLSAPKLPSLWIPGGVLIGGVVVFSAGMITLFADNDDFNIVFGATLIGFGMAAIIASAFIGTAFSVRRKTIKELYGPRLSANGFSLSF